MNIVNNLLIFISQSLINLLSKRIYTLQNCIILQNFVILKLLSGQSLKLIINCCTILSWWYFSIIAGIDADFGTHQRH
jgi:hypothetical protein